MLRGLWDGVAVGLGETLRCAVVGVMTSPEPVKNRGVVVRTGTALEHARYAAVARPLFRRQLYAAPERVDRIIDRTNHREFAQSKDFACRRALGYAKVRSVGAGFAELACTAAATVAIHALTSVCGRGGRPRSIATSSTEQKRRVRCFRLCSSISHWTSSEIDRPLAAGSGSDGRGAGINNMKSACLTCSNFRRGCTGGRAQQVNSLE